MILLVNGSGGADNGDSPFVTRQSLLSRHGHSQGSVQTPFDLGLMAMVSFLDFLFCLVAINRVKYDFII